MRTLLVTLILLFSSSALANEVQFDMDVASTRITPCNFWSSAGNGRYACSMYPMSISVVEAHYIQALERRVRALESRLAELEESNSVEN